MPDFIFSIGVNEKDTPVDDDLIPIANAFEKSEGSMRPSERQQMAKPFLESHLDSPLKDEDHLAINGWLSKEGAMYVCGYRGHTALTRSLGMASERDMECAGWCKLQNLKWFVSGRYISQKLTDAQWGYIETWFMKNQFPLAILTQLNKLGD